MTKKNVIVLMERNSHIEIINRYLTDKGINPTILKCKTLSKNIEYTIQQIKEATKTNTYDGLIVSSEIDNYKLENLPNFFKYFREILKEKPIIFFHPSRVHSEDRKLIFNSVGEPFRALQGYDIDCDPVESINPILSAFFS